MLWSAVLQDTWATEGTVESHTRNGCYLIGIFGFLPGFQMVRDTNRSMRVPQRGYFTFWIKKTSDTALNFIACNRLSSSCPAHPEGKMISYFQFVDYLLTIYTTQDIIAEPHFTVVIFR